MKKCNFVSVAYTIIVLVIISLVAVQKFSFTITNSLAGLSYILLMVSPIFLKRKGTVISVLICIIGIIVMSQKLADMFNEYHFAIRTYNIAAIIAILIIDTLYQKIVRESNSNLYKAIHDGLTGLYNKRYFDLQLDYFTKQTNRNSSSLCLLIIDVDKFKNINDSYGHSSGDSVLIQISKILERTFRDSDLIFRHGGDEFSVILPNTTGDNLKLIITRLKSYMSKQFKVDNQYIDVTLSIGATYTEGEIIDTKTLFNYADNALYKVKQSGRNGFKLYTA